MGMEVVFAFKEETMRCLFCGLKYNEQNGDIAIGFCSNTCAKLWEESIEHSRHKDREIEDKKFAESLKEK